ncbi:MAG TPA: efflux RND transporter periplasmic adaptor subunit [Bryobacteraceae bacterium]|nr:efflux RND transporter periplasmic adaptor subunit [Bryobacteraceae bacterium]
MVIEQEEAITNAVSKPPHEPARPPSTVWRWLSIFLLLAVLGVAYVIYSGITARAKANTVLEKTTADESIPTVSVMKPLATSQGQEVVLPGNMQAYVDTPVWARASGYIKAWHTDIGARVKRGQLLAEIEAPEIEQQLQQAKENLSTSQANLKLSQITAERYTGLFKTDSVAKQDVDNAVQDAEAKTSTVSAAKANVSRLEQLVGYERVYAPFDGVITARNIDVGTLVDADANTAGKELFHLAANHTLRVFVSVPEVYSRVAQPGVNSYLTLTEYPGRKFTGTIVRNAEAIDVNSRTLLVEVDVKNPTGELLPGSYVSVHFKLGSKANAVTLPSNVLLFRSQGLQVALVRDGRVALVPVTLGRDYGDSVEIISGVKPGDVVVTNPSDSIASGQPVRVTNASAE